MPSTKSSLNFSKLNLLMTCCRPLVSLLFSPEMTLSMLFVQFDLDLQRYPHPSPTDSLGPPLLSAMIGTPEYMASQGTIPKCSFSGV